VLYVLLVLVVNRLNPFREILSLHDKVYTYFLRTAIALNLQRHLLSPNVGVLEAIENMVQTMIEISKMNCPKLHGQTIKRKLRGI
jgi:hypothetical protein